MCTAITFSTDDKLHFLARTMDFSFELNASPVYVPNNHQFHSLVPDSTFTTQYSFIGAGKDVNGYIFADGLNEKGFSIASLYFEKNAKYSNVINPKLLNISSTDMVAWALGNVSSVADFEQQYIKLNIIDMINPVLNVNVPLHWIVSDKTGSTGVLEITKSGTKFYKNEVGVMTNSPEFPWHMDNLSHYSNLQPTEHEPKKYGNYITITDGPGSGALGLPGDYTSTSRFIRSAFLRENSDTSAGIKNGLASIIHILNAVDIPKNAKITNKGTSDYTQYKGVMDLNNLSYYFMEYDSFELNRIDLDKIKNKKQLQVFN